MRTKRNNKIGSPCLIPFVELKNLNSASLVMIENFTVEIHVLMRFIHLESKSKFSSIETREFQRTLSYALVISRLRAIPFILGMKWRESFMKLE